MATVQITDQTFEKEVIETSKEMPVLVDFWAQWCMPCRMVAPILEDLSEELDGKVKIAKLEVDENPQKANEYQIMSIPNMKLFKDGKVVEEFVGVQPRDIIKQVLEKHIDNK